MRSFLALAVALFFVSTVISNGGMSGVQASTPAKSFLSASQLSKMSKGNSKTKEDGFDSSEVEYDIQAAADELKPSVNPRATATARRASTGGDPTAAATTTAPVTREQVQAAVFYGGPALALLFALVFWRGRQRNTLRAYGWYNQFQPLLSQHFATVGMGGDSSGSGSSGSGSGGGGPLRVSHSGFKVYAAGRRFCKGLIVDLNLRHRHNLIEVARAVMDPRRGKDCVTLDFLMEDRAVEAMVLAVAPTKHAARLHADSADLADYAKPVPHAELSAAGLTVLCDCPEAVPLLLPQRIVAVLTDPLSRKWFRSLHLTDQNAVSTVGTATLSTKALRFQFDLPSTDNMAALQRLTEMALWCVDHVAASTFLTRQQAGRAAKARRDAAAQRFRQSHDSRSSRVQHARAVERRREKEEYETLSKKQQARRDAADSKRAKRKAALRMRAPKA